MDAKTLGCAAFLASLTLACGDKTNYPYFTPPVKAAAPSGLQASGSSGAQALMLGHGRDLSLDMNDFQNRFFTDGPTNLFGILASIDSRISGLNNQSGSDCTKQTPVPVSFSIFGQSVTFQFQCYQNITPGFTGDPGLIEWGQDGNGVFYLYSANGAGWTAAVASPLADANTVSQASERYVVNAWASVGVGNGVNPNSNSGGSCGAAWDDCSYGVMQIHADPSKPLFEMTVAGTNIGYCGAQIVSDGNTIFGEGSPGGLVSGSNPATPCSATDTVCVQASNTNTAASTCTVSASNFSLPPLGLAAVGNIPASDYPGGSSDQITLTGNANDSVHFGPTTHASGVTSF